MEKKKSNSYLKNKNIQDGIVVFCLGAALAGYSLFMFYTTAVQTEWKMSPYLFPVLVSVFTILMAFSLIADGKYEVAHAAEEGERGGTIQLKKVIVVVFLAIVYYLLLSFITFIPATVVFLIAMFLFFGERCWWLIALLSIGTSGIIYVLFGVLLNVRLP